MDLQDGVVETHQHGGCCQPTPKTHCYEYKLWSLVPSPRALKVLYWQDDTAQLMLFHTDSQGVRHLWHWEGTTQEIDTITRKIRKEL